MAALVELARYGLDISEEELMAISMPGLAVKFREANDAYLRGGPDRHNIPVSVFREVVQLKCSDDMVTETVNDSELCLARFLPFLAAIKSREITFDAIRDA